MIVKTIEGKRYLLPSGLSKFQLDLYVQLIDWKWRNITTEPGYYIYKGRQIPYDAILPTDWVDKLPMIYPAVVDELLRHHEVNPFRLHIHFNHVASSQAAAVNLFLPILQHSLGKRVFASIKPDFASLATDHLDRGFCFEYWGGNFVGDRTFTGPLGDKTERSGTDSDIAIAYRNHDGQLCLWLIEHKLSEDEFTHCGGFKSKGRTDKQLHDCTLSFQEILENKNRCYQHDIRRREYWNITQRNQEFFVNHEQFVQCPFQSGLNQLWRNQLLALSIEQDTSIPFQKAFFSVVRHPKNAAMHESLMQFQGLIANNQKFSVLTSEDFLSAADSLQDDKLKSWASWYRTLYL